jgi:flagellar hook-associated protein 1 FlgK
MGVLDVGITALNAFRTQLTTTSHNVANVNTEGYTRQIAQLGTLPPTSVGVGYIGTGVKVEDISRQFDQFLADRVRQYTSSNEEAAIFLQRAQRVDNIIADPDAGLSTALQDCAGCG